MNLVTRWLEWIGVEDGANVETITAAVLGALERQLDESRRWTARAIAAERRLARELAEPHEPSAGGAEMRAALAVQYAAVRQSSAELRAILHRRRAVLADARRRLRWLAARCAATEARLALAAHRERGAHERPEDVLNELERELALAEQEVPRRRDLA